MARIESLTPSEIFFSQDSIKNCFGDGTCHRRKLIGETLDDILSSECSTSIRDIPTISVVKRYGRWVTADNRRLWVFKKLHKLGKCDKITVLVTNYLNPKKNVIQSTTRIRQGGNPGGSLWRILENQINAGISPVQQKSSSEVFGFSTQRNVLLEFSGVQSQSFCERETLSTKSFSYENKPADYHGFDSRAGYLSEAFPVPVDRTLHTHSENSNPYNMVHRGTSSYPGSSGRFYQGTAKQLMHSDESVRSTQWGSYTFENVGISSRTNFDRTPQEGNSLTATEATRGGAYDSKISHTQPSYVQEKLQSPLADNYEKVVYLNPLDVGFAGKSIVSFNGENIGEWLDDLSERFNALSMKIPLNVFEYQEKYYSKEVQELLESQILHRLTGNTQICGARVPKPIDVSIFHLHDSVWSTDRIGGQKWKSFVTLNSLTTKKKLSISLSEIFFTKSSISDTYRGRSIAKGLVEVFTSGMSCNELNVMEYENKYYALENKKLWILKHAEKAIGKLTISCNVKISIDYIMFHSFTLKGITTVDFQLSRFRHTDEEKFLLEYIHKCDSCSFANRRSSLCAGIGTRLFQETPKHLSMDNPVCSTQWNSYTSILDKSPYPQEGNSSTAIKAPRGDTYASKQCQTTLEQERDQSPLARKYETIVYLNPLDVGFVGKSFVSFNREKFGEWLDELSERFPTLSLKMPLNVFEYQEQYYSEEVIELLASQILHRLTGNVRICGIRIPKPIHVSVYSLHHSVISSDRIGGEKWKSLVTLNGLSTKKRLSISLSEIFYTRSSISDTYRGRSIAKGLFEIFTSGMCSHELNVMEYENKYYALENKRLWILKHAEKVLGKLTITGNVKISMDYIMFCSFTVKDIKTADVQLSSDEHSDEEKFILEYINKMNPCI